MGQMGQKSLTIYFLVQHNDIIFILDFRAVSNIVTIFVTLNIYLKTKQIWTRNVPIQHVLTDT